MPLQMVMIISKRQILIFSMAGILDNSIAKLKARAVIAIYEKKREKRKQKNGERK